MPRNPLQKVPWYFWAGAGVLLITALIKNQLFDLAAQLIAKFEGFRPTPYWDVSRYSWGYGTPAPGPTGQITQEQARKDMTAVNRSNYTYLRPKITRSLTNNQWAALLSLAYNLGPGSAAKLAPNINAGNWDALQTQWNAYINAGGVPDDNLIKRRAQEWATFAA